MEILLRFAAKATGITLVLFTRFMTALRINWLGCEPVPRVRVYFANHSSNGDFMLIWAALPPPMRRTTRPVAGADYWLKNKLRAFIARHVIHAVLIDRRAEYRDQDPIEQMATAVDEGASLIIFPEGGRNRSEDPLLPFKAGLYNLGVARPDVDLVPTWIENLNRVMPAGEIIPIPLVCSVTFGEPIHVKEGEDKDAFVARAAAALLALRPERATGARAAEDASEPS